MSPFLRMLPPPPRGLAENISLAAATTLGTGGAARYWLEVENETTLETTLEWAAARQLPLQVIGGGSNLVCADEGFDGLVLRIAVLGIETRTLGDSVEITAGAGEIWDTFVAGTVARNLAGLECLSGIPGRVGATPIQNVGAYGQDVSQTLIRVRCFDRAVCAFVEFTRAECEFGYRDSRFKGRDDARYIVTKVTFALAPGGSPNIAYGDLARRVGPTPSLAEVRDAVLLARGEKGMLANPDDADGRSCGSFFLNPILPRAEFERLCSEASPRQVPHYFEPDGRVKVPAAWLIESSGVRKGERLGKAGVSSKHALCLVAHAGATSREVRELAVRVKRSVADRFGVELEPEPRFVGLAPP
jgi:UDP-N-acetylmuramate dehydrogenase